MIGRKLFGRPRRSAVHRCRFVSRRTDFESGKSRCGRLTDCRLRHPGCQRDGQGILRLIFAGLGVRFVVVDPDPLQLEQRRRKRLDGQIGGWDLARADVLPLAQVGPVPLQAVAQVDAVGVILRKGQRVDQRVLVLILKAEAIGPRHARRDDRIAEGLVEKDGKVFDVVPVGAVGLGNEDDGGIILPGPPEVVGADQHRDQGEQDQQQNERQNPPTEAADWWPDICPPASGCCRWRPHRPSASFLCHAKNPPFSKKFLL